MDAMKIITEGMIKENKPKFEVGDTVRVSVRIKEGERERIQAFEGTVIAKAWRRKPKPLPFAALLTVWAWSACSPSTRPSWKKWRSFAAVRSAVRSFSICGSRTGKAAKVKGTHLIIANKRDNVYCPLFRYMVKHKKSLFWAILCRGGPSGRAAGELHNGRKAFSAQPGSFGLVRRPWCSRWLFWCWCSPFAARIVVVSGHSMEHTLQNGDRLLIQHLYTPQRGDVVLDGYINYGKPW